MNQAQAWALRCQLEMQRHQSAVFTTLTYTDEALPITLAKRHLQLFLKRIRKSSPTPIRFFASGEYGERTLRPHYHAILYGLSMADADAIETTWGLGHCRTTPVTPARIAYVAGYTAKKTGWYQLQKEERVDPETGECYTWQPPFIQMSRRPGIGGHAREYPASWRSYAIFGGHKMGVPRFYHESWKQQATEADIETLRIEKENSLKNYVRTYEQRQAAEKIAQAKQRIKADARKY